MQIIAHRGASADRPEHTIDAYELALEQGAGGIECDIRLTADGQLACIHDRTLRRVAGLDIPVSAMTRQDLSRVNVGTPDYPADVLYLEDLLDLISDKPTNIFIETKHPVRYGGAVEHYLFNMLGRFGLSEDPRVHIISFSAQSLQRMGHLTPQLHRVLLRRDRHAAIDPSAWADSPHFAYGPSIKRARRNTISIARAQSTYVWTVDREEDVRWAARNGIKWLATNVPQLARTWAEDELATYQQSNPTFGWRWKRDFPSDLETAAGTR